MNPTFALALLVVAVPAWAQPVATSAATAESTEAALVGEPNVRRTVIEDEGSRIDELKVRGQTRRITVTPKLGTTKSYEIITGDASLDTTAGTGGARSAVGKRVWNVLAF